MRSMVLDGLVDCISKRAESRELCLRRGSPPNTSPPSRATLLRSDTDLPAAGAPAASACPGPDSGGAGTRRLRRLRRLPAAGSPDEAPDGAGGTAAASGDTGGRAAAGHAALPSTDNAFPPHVSVVDSPRHPRESRTNGNSWVLVSNVRQTSTGAVISLGGSGGSGSKRRCCIGFHHGERSAGTFLDNVTFRVEETHDQANIDLQVSIREKNQSNSAPTNARLITMNNHNNNILHSRTTISTRPRTAQCCIQIQNTSWSWNVSIARAGPARTTKYTWTTRDPTTRTQ